MNKKIALLFLCAVIVHVAKSSENPPDVPKTVGSLPQTVPEYEVEFLSMVKKLSIGEGAAFGYPVSPENLKENLIEKIKIPFDEKNEEYILFCPNAEVDKNRKDNSHISGWVPIHMYNLTSGAWSDARDLNYQTCGSYALSTNGNRLTIYYVSDNTKISTDHHCAVMKSLVQEKVPVAICFAPETHIDDWVRICNSAGIGVASSYFPSGFSNREVKIPVSFMGLWKDNIYFSVILISLMTCVGYELYCRFGR